jgi:hypothetical protein
MTKRGDKDAVSNPWGSPCLDAGSYGICYLSCLLFKKLFLMAILLAIGHRSYVARAKQGRCRQCLGAEMLWGTTTSADWEDKFPASSLQVMVIV